MKTLCIRTDLERTLTSGGVNLLRLRCRLNKVEWYYKRSCESFITLWMGIWFSKLTYIVINNNVSLSISRIWSYFFWNYNVFLLHNIYTENATWFPIINYQNVITHYNKSKRTFVLIICCLVVSICLFIMSICVFPVPTQNSIQQKDILIQCSILVDRTIVNIILKRQLHITVRFKMPAGKSYKFQMIISKTAN